MCTPTEQPHAAEEYHAIAAYIAADGPKSEEAAPDTELGPKVPPVPLQRLTGVLTEAEVLEIYAYVGVPAEYMSDLLKIAYCESQFRVDALGDGGDSRGLHQIQKIWFDLAGENWENWNDPVVNSRVAIRVIQYDIERGYHPFKQWSCSVML